MATRDDCHEGGRGSDGCRADDDDDEAVDDGIGIPLLSFLTLFPTPPFDGVALLLLDDGLAAAAADAFAALRSILLLGVPGALLLLPPPAIADEVDS